MSLRINLLFILFQVLYEHFLFNLHFLQSLHIIGVNFNDLSNDSIGLSSLTMDSR